MRHFGRERNTYPEGYFSGKRDPESLKMLSRPQEG